LCPFKGLTTFKGNIKIGLVNSHAYSNCCVFELIFYTAVGLRISPSRKAIMAITNSICIRLPIAVKKKPIAQPIINITAIMYSNEFMVVLL